MRISSTESRTHLAMKSSKHSHTNTLLKAMVMVRPTLWIAAFREIKSHSLVHLLFFCINTRHRSFKHYHAWVIGSLSMFPISYPGWGKLPNILGNEERCVKYPRKLGTSVPYFLIPDFPSHLSDIWAKGIVVTVSNDTHGQLCCL